MPICSRRCRGGKGRRARNDSSLPTLLPTMMRAAITRRRICCFCFCGIIPSPSASIQPHLASGAQATNILVRCCHVLVPFLYVLFSHLDSADEVGDDDPTLSTVCVSFESCDDHAMTRWAFAPACWSIITSYATDFDEIVVA